MTAVSANAEADLLIGCGAVAWLIIAVGQAAAIDVVVLFIPCFSLAATSCCAFPCCRSRLLLTTARAALCSLRRHSRRALRDNMELLYAK